MLGNHQVWPSRWGALCEAEKLFFDNFYAKQSHKKLVFVDIPYAIGCHDVCDVGES